MGHIIGIDHCSAVQVLNLFSPPSMYSPVIPSMIECLECPFTLHFFLNVKHSRASPLIGFASLSESGVGKRIGKCPIVSVLIASLVCLNRIHNFALSQQILMSSPLPHDYLLPMTTTVPIMASTIEWKIFVTPHSFTPRPLPTGWPVKSVQESANNR